MWRVAILVLLSMPAQAAEKIRFDLYKWQHRIGTETAYVERGKGGAEVRVVFSFTDRTTPVPLAATLDLNAAGQPRRFQLWGQTARQFDADDLVVVTGARVAITQRGATRTVAAPRRFFVSSSYAPVIITEELLRYWTHHGRPPALPVFPLGEVTIERRGQDTVPDDDGKATVLDRYALGGLRWGKETVWLDANGALVALKGTDTEFDHFEATRAGYSQALGALVARAAADGMAGLVEASRGLGNQPGATVAYTGARLVDGTGRPPLEDAVVVVRQGKIASVGQPVPAGARVVNLAGKTIVPGLWDMHAHVEQVEWGPLYLAAGVTTVRDCGNEPDFIRSVRETVDAGRGVGPRVLLACLVDGEGEGVIGNDRLRSAAEIPALVKRFVAAGCAQVKIYSSLSPELVAPLAEAAHHAGLTVTGHVPNGMGAVRAVNAGLDQISHVGYVARALLPPNYDPDANLPGSVVTKALQELDLTSPAAKETLAFFARRRTVVDPTVALQELFTLAPDQTVEPGLAKVPAPLRQALTSPRSPEERQRGQARLAKLLAVVGALHKAGVPIVAGTDQAVPGHSLHRELELYVQAGLSPLEALQAATLVPARAMKKDAEAGTVEPGKRADFIAVAGDPLTDIRALRKVTLVVAAGIEYEPATLWKSAGFEP
jgi:imidazolonepropionase-like amidohydrolase